MRTNTAAALIFTIGTSAIASAQTNPDNPPATMKSSPEKNWPSPINDEPRFTYVLADVLEFQPKSNDNSYRWDVEGWRGGEYSRIWFKTEGQGSSGLKADYDIEAQLLYGRFVKRYYDFQVGVRAETQSFKRANVTRLHAVIGLQGLVPYKYEIAPTLFISQRGDVSFRLAATRDLLVTQRLILQPRLEINAAIQQVERFTTGRGLNDAEFGLRVRYEITRQFAPYIGVSYEQSFFDTANFVRQDGGNSRQIRFVVGMRLWH